MGYVVAMVVAVVVWELVLRSTVLPWVMSWFNKSA